MRRYFGWALAAVVSFTLMGLGTASAADMAVKARPVVAPVPVFSWTGFYAGLNVGGNWAHSDFSWVEAPGFPDLPAFIAGRTAGAVARFEPSGFTGGGQIGYNYQAGAAVFGVEADVEYLDGSASRAVNLVNFGLPALNTINESVRANWLATFRGRLGWAVDRVLFYGTAGGAVGEVRFFDLTNYPGTFQGGTQTATMWGWVAGAGIEYAATNNWILRAEYLHVDLGNASFSTIPLTPVAIPTALITHNHNYRTDIGRVGISYKFGGPIVAKY